MTDRWALQEGVEGDAWFSPCGGHRLGLWRWWGYSKRFAAFGINPSSAGADRDDPTVRKLIHYGRAESYSGFDLGNLATLISKKPIDLLKADRRNVELADAVIHSIITDRDCAAVLCMWGKPTNARLRAYIDSRARVVMAFATSHGVPTLCLGTTACGRYPRHPLYLRNDTKMRPFP